MIPLIRKHRIKILTFVFLASFSVACDGSYSSGTPGADSSNTGGGTNPTAPNTTSNGGITCGTDAFCVNVSPPKDTTMILHEDGIYSQPCTVTAGSNTACILEADELDLYSQGVTLNYNVPAGMCSYLNMQPYFYGPSDYRVGRGIFDSKTRSV